ISSMIISIFRLPSKTDAGPLRGHKARLAGRSLKRSRKRRLRAWLLHIPRHRDFPLSDGLSEPCRSFLVALSLKTGAIFSGDCATLRTNRLSPVCGNLPVRDGPDLSPRRTTITARKQFWSYLPVASTEDSYGIPRQKEMEISSERHST